MLENKNNKKRNIWIVTLLLLIALLLWAYPYVREGYFMWEDQKKIKEKSAEILKNIDLPKGLENKLVVYGNPKADKVLINAQGGPTTTLDIGELKGIVTGTGGIDSKEFLIVDVHQCQTLISEEMEKTEITFEEAKKCDEESVKTLADTVAFFKEKNKKVYVLGISLEPLL